jgi:hypothetical protein
MTMDITRREFNSFLGVLLGYFTATRAPWIGASPEKHPSYDPFCLLAATDQDFLDCKTALRTNGGIIAGTGIAGVERDHRRGLILHHNPVKIWTPLIVQETMLITPGGRIILATPLETALTMQRGNTLNLEHKITAA